MLLGHAPPLCRIRVTGAAGDPITVLQDLPESDLPGLCRAADYLLSRSRWEGFGLAIAEALAVGTPALLPAGLDGPRTAHRRRRTYLSRWRRTARC